MFLTRKITRNYDGEKGERLWFSISNNGNRSWSQASPEAVKEALTLLDDCSTSIARFKRELGDYLPVPPLELDLLDKEERSLLLYFESCCVDHAGKVNTARMNNDDRKIAERWNAEGFITYGRIRIDDVVGAETHAVKLSEDAWRLAHEERRARAERMDKARTWMTTAEKAAL